jgi:hypothetical protein
MLNGTYADYHSFPSACSHTKFLKLPNSALATVASIFVGNNLGSLTKGEGSVQLTSLY